MNNPITAAPDPPTDTLLAQLTQQAEALATAHAQNTQYEQAGDPIRWRTASLVWPLFTASLMKKG